jgi:hypothetical protein
MIVVSHYCHTENIGDRVSAPHLYFDLGTVEVIHYDARVPPCDFVIFGGGALGNGLGGSASVVQARSVIAWGVGMSRGGRTEPGPAPGNLTLYGSREWRQPGSIWVPCASCMSPLFDRDYRIEHDAVVYLNEDEGASARYPIEPHGAPVLGNHAAFEDAVRFLGSGETVVTNSYHGAYWAQLLCRRVIVSQPYSSKFYGFRTMPALALEGDWRAALPGAKADEDALAVAEPPTSPFMRG